MEFNVKTNNYPPLAVVTGAADRVGKAIALHLAKEGFAIGLHYHASHEKAAQTTREIEALGVPVVPLRADLANLEDVKGMFETVKSQKFPLTLLVNSASIMTRTTVQDITPEQWEQTIALNLRAPLFCAQAAAKCMPNTGGLIVNITDTGSRKVWSSYLAYTVSKAGLDVLTRLLARSLAPTIRVNAVAPGLILPPPDMPEAEWKRLEQRLPLKHSGTPADVARAVVFLVNNPYITGETLFVDGGYQII